MIYYYYYYNWNNEKLKLDLKDKIKDHINFDKSIDLKKKEIKRKETKLKFVLFLLKKKN